MPCTMSQLDQNSESVYLPKQWASLRGGRGSVCGEESGSTRGQKTFLCESTLPINSNGGGGCPPGFRESLPEALHSFS